MIIAPNPATQVICAGFTANIAVTNSGGTPGYTYQWSNANTSSSQTVSPGTTTDYSVTVTDANGCTSVTTDTVVVTQLAVVTVTSDSVCWGDSSTLTATGGPTYHWSNGATTASITVYDTVTTNYTVYVTANGCQSLTVQGTAFILGTQITASFTQDSSLGYMPLTVNFINNSTGGNLYFWYFGDTLSGPLDSSNLKNPVHTYDSSGTYRVLLVVVNQYGCYDTISDYITVEKKSHFNLPNFLLQMVMVKTICGYPITSILPPPMLLFLIVGERKLKIGPPSPDGTEPQVAEAFAPMAPIITS